MTCLVLVFQLKILISPRHGKMCMKIKIILLFILSSGWAFGGVESFVSTIPAPKKEQAGIPEITKGLLSIHQQGLIFDHIAEVLSSPEYREKNTIIEVLAPDGNYISRVGEDGIERIIFTFHAIEEEVGRLGHQYPKIRYLGGVMLAYENEDFLFWQPIYKTRFTGSAEPGNKIDASGNAAKKD